MASGGFGLDTYRYDKYISDQYNEDLPYEITSINQHASRALCVSFRTSSERLPKWLAVVQEYYGENHVMDIIDRSENKVPQILYQVNSKYGAKLFTITIYLNTCTISVQGNHFIDFHKQMKELVKAVDDIQTDQGVDISVPISPSINRCDSTDSIIVEDNTNQFSSSGWLNSTVSFLQGLFTTSTPLNEDYILKPVEFSLTPIQSPIRGSDFTPNLHASHSSQTTINDTDELVRQLIQIEPVQTASTPVRVPLYATSENTVINDTDELVRQLILVEPVDTNNNAYDSAVTSTPAPTSLRIMDTNNIPNDSAMIEEEVARRVEELVAKRVAEELEKRRDEIEAEVLRRVEEAKKEMEKEMMAELEKQRERELEIQKSTKSIPAPTFSHIMDTNSAPNDSTGTTKSTSAPSLSSIMDTNNTPYNSAMKPTAEFPPSTSSLIKSWEEYHTNFPSLYNDEDSTNSSLPNFPPPYSEAIKNKADSEEEIICVGTSMVDGLGFQLNKLGTKVTCYRYGGASIERLISRVPHILPSHKYGLRSPTVYVQCAGNDADSHASTSHIISDYDCLIAAIKRQCPGAKIVCGRVSPRLKASFATNTSIDRINTYLSIRSSCIGDIHFLDACPPPRAGYYTRKGIHFNYAGKCYFAKQIHTYLCENFLMKAKTNQF